MIILVLVKHFQLQQHAFNCFVELNWFGFGKLRAFSWSLMQAAALACIYYIKKFWGFAYIKFNFPLKNLISIRSLFQLPLISKKKVNRKPRISGSVKWECPFFKFCMLSLKAKGGLIISSKFLPLQIESLVDSWIIQAP